MVEATLEERARRLKLWGIQSLHASMLLGGRLRETEALAHARTFVGEFSSDPDAASMLVLAGPPGVGKTVAACYVASAIRPPGKWLGDESPKFRHVSQVAETGIMGDADDKKERDLLRRTSCLVIDDVGVEYKTDMFLTLFDSLMNHRYASAGVTVITTNLPSREFEQRYGQRVFDRIRGRGCWVEMNHESLRGR